MRPFPIKVGGVKGNEMPQEYVIVYVELVGPEITDPVLFIEKNRSGQEGRFNLPGGKIEPGETPIQAAVRELKEETGIVPAEVKRGVRKMGIITGPWGTVHCMTVPILYEKPKPQEGETERVFWGRWEEYSKDSRLMPNLKVIVPLMRCGVTGWEIRNDSSLPNEDHVLELTLKGN